GQPVRRAGGAGRRRLPVVPGRLGVAVAGPGHRGAAVHRDRRQQRRAGDRQPGHPVVAADAGPRAAAGPGPGLGAVGVGQPGHRARGGAARPQRDPGGPAGAALAGQRTDPDVAPGLDRGDRAGRPLAGGHAARLLDRYSGSPTWASSVAASGPSSNSTWKPASSRIGTFSCTALACLLPGDSPTTTNEVFFDTELADLPPRTAI